MSSTCADSLCNTQPPHVRAHRASPRRVWRRQAAQLPRQRSRARDLGARGRNQVARFLMHVHEAPASSSPFLSCLLAHCNTIRAVGQRAPSRHWPCGVRDRAGGARRQIFHGSVAAADSSAWHAAHRPPQRPCSDPDPLFVRRRLWLGAWQRSLKLFQKCLGS